MTDEKKETLATRVQRLRRERAWSQDQLSGAAGLSLRTVQRIENGRSASPETLQALAAAFELETRILTDCQIGESAERSEKRPLAAERRFETVGWILIALVVAFVVYVISAGGHFHVLDHMFRQP